jgi:hypothetical protein
MTAHSNIAALQQERLALETECHRIALEADKEQERLKMELDQALRQPSVPQETMLALQNNDWAQRLNLWNRRALAAEAEVERLEEALLEEQRNSTFHTLASQAATSQSVAGTPAHGFARLDSFQSLRSGLATPGRGGTLSASWSRVGSSGHLGSRGCHSTAQAVWSGATGEMEEESDGWLYNSAGEPMNVTWDLVGMVLDIAAWGPGRSRRSENEDPARVLRGLKTLIKSWKFQWEKKSSSTASGGDKDKEVKKLGKVVSDLTNRLHKTERSLQKALTPRQGNTPRAGGGWVGGPSHAIDTSAGDEYHSVDQLGPGRGGGGSRGGSMSAREDARERQEREKTGGYITSDDSDHTVLDEDV